MGEQDSIFVKMLIPQKPFSVKEVLSVEIPAVDGPYLVLPRRAHDAATDHLGQTRLEYCPADHEKADHHDHYIIGEP